jgi:hypothetical protein
VDWSVTGSRFSPRRGEAIKKTEEEIELIPILTANGAKVRGDQKD